MVRSEQGARKGRLIGNIDDRAPLLDLKCAEKYQNSLPITAHSRTAALPGGLNRSAQHSNLLTKMECGHEAATSHLLFCGSAV
jgi:hypothetical protein